MTLDELIKDFRVAAQDKIDPYLFAQPDVTRWLIEAEQEACIRGRLLHESANESVCSVDVVPGEAVYPLHPALYELDHLGLLETGATERCRVKLVSREWLDDNQSGWRDETGRPRFAIQSDTTLRLVPVPSASATLKLEGYRLPLRGLTEDKASKPEIHPAHHRHLVHWALHRAFSVPDAESIDRERAAQSLADFVAYFGERPDSDLRRITRHDVEHHNKAWP